jgi:hypothetical protein
VDDHCVGAVFEGLEQFLNTVYSRCHCMKRLW